MPEEVVSSILPQANEQNSPITQHIWCSVQITKKMEDVFVAYIIGQGTRNISEYVVYLSTPGGNPYSAATLYDFVKSLPQKTTIYNMGQVASAGVPFFLSFKNRIGVPDCSFMIHPATVQRTMLPEQVSVFDLDTQIGTLKAIEKKTQAIVLKETTAKAKKKLTKSKIANDTSKSTTYEAADALAYGFIDKIEMPTLPSTGLVYITDQGLTTLPG